MAINQELIPIPDQFYCPILHEVLEDPVTTCDGHTYERVAIEAWFRRRPMFSDDGEPLPPRSPLTNQPLETTRLTPNLALKQAIESFVSMRPDLRRVPAKMDLSGVRAAIETFEVDVENKRQGWEQRYKTSEEEVERLKLENARLRDEVEPENERLKIENEKLRLENRRLYVLYCRSFRNTWLPWLPSRS